MATELKPLLPQAFQNTQLHNVYFKEDDLSLPEAHPARRKVRTSQKSIAYDLIPQDAGIRLIYEKGGLLNLSTTCAPLKTRITQAWPNCKLLQSDDDGYEYSHVPPKPNL